jgi:hypothetical protein
MWVTFIATAIAASTCLSMVNLASHLNRVRDARLSPVIESTAPSSAPLPDWSLGTITGDGQNNGRNLYPNPGV